MAPKSFQKKHLRVGFDQREGPLAGVPYSMRAAAPESTRCRYGSDRRPTTWAMFYANHHPGGWTNYPEQVYPVDCGYQWLDAKGEPHRRLLAGRDVVAGSDRAG